MPTNAFILQNAPISCVLAGNDVSKGALFGQRIDPMIATKIYATYFIIKKIYDLDNNYSGMTAACLYLWELMGKYGIMAQYYTDGGGSVAPPTPGTENIYPFMITSGNFESDGVSYVNENTVNDTLSLFVNEYSNQWLVAGSDTFAKTSTGFIMNIPGFDANTQTWNIMVQKLNS